MPGFGRVVVPPPATAVLSASEEQISGFKLPVLAEAAIVTDLGGWVIGDAGGGAASQNGRFALYADDGSGLRPGAKICQTVEGAVVRNDPLRTIRLAVEGAPPTIMPGQYWLAVHLGTNVGVGVWIVRGVVGGSNHVINTPSAYGPTTPNPYPVAGGASGANSGGVGVVYAQPPQEITGTICGTFLCGTRLAGETTYRLNAPQLRLEGGRFLAYTASQIVIVAFQKPQLILRPKAFAAGPGEGVAMEKPQLILRGKAITAAIITVQSFAKPQLILTNKAFGLVASYDVPVGKPQLILTAGLSGAGEPLLAPTVPQDIVLVPTDPQDVLLVPTDEDDLLLVPTTERFI